MTQQPHTPMYEVKGEFDGDYTNGLTLCPWCVPQARIEGYHVTAQIVTPATCQSCGRHNVPVPAYAVRRALRAKTLAVGRAS